MGRNPSKHAVSLEAEQALIAAAQRGSKRAVTMLVALELPFLRSFAKRVANRIIHKREIESDLDDLVSAGIIEFLRKIPKYDPKRANGARIRNVAFLDVKRAMIRHACDGLESVRLPRDNRVHRAHKDFEAGMSEAELSEKHPDVPIEALRSLHRTTVSIEHMAQWEEPGEEPAEKVERILVRIWDDLTDAERAVLTMRRLDVARRHRARRLGVSYADLAEIEERVFERVRDLVKHIEDEPVIEPTEVAKLGPVWDELTLDERRAVFSLRHLRDRGVAHRARWLRVSADRVRAVERNLVRRVRKLVA